MLASFQSRGTLPDKRIIYKGFLEEQPAQPRTHVGSVHSVRLGRMPCASLCLTAVIGFFLVGWRSGSGRARERLAPQAVYIVQSLLIVAIHGVRQPGDLGRASP